MPFSPPSLTALLTRNFCLYFGSYWLVKFYFYMSVQPDLVLYNTLLRYILLFCRHIGSRSKFDLIKIELQD